MTGKDEPAEKIHTLVNLVARLRGPGGCPWDARQNDWSIKSYLLEEAYEVADAVERGNPDEVRMELGDLLFQILFLAELASERGEFDLMEVAEGITAKMIRRHPHVFGDASVSGPEDVVENWDRIKQAEKDRRGDETSMLRDVPSGLPALLRAHRLQQRAERRPGATPEACDCWDPVLDAFLRLQRAMETPTASVVEDPAGELLFALVALCRRFGLNAEEILQRANRRFVEGVEIQPAADDNGRNSEVCRKWAGDPDD